MFAIILRLPLVYGPYDLEGFMSVNIVGALIYRYLNEKMKVLWDDSKRIHTIHVVDTCRAIAFMIGYDGSDRIFNVVDDGDTT